jgi:hypothetical protein
MNFWRQMQMWLTGSRARRMFPPLPLDGDDRRQWNARGVVRDLGPHLTPHECPSRVGGMAGAGEIKYRVFIKTRLNFSCAWHQVAERLTNSWAGRIHLTSSCCRPADSIKPSRQSRTKRAILLTIAWVGLVFGLEAQQFGEAAFNFVGYDPAGSITSWSQDGQGLAHDDNNWFITSRYALWKVPVTSYLHVNPDSAPGVIHTNIDQIPQLAGYNHFGDPELFATNGVGYLFVPVVDYCGVISLSCTPPPHAIAVFKGEDLSFVALQSLPANFNGRFVSGESWCAFSPDGDLYVPNHGAYVGEPLTLTRFSCDFAALASGHRSPFLTPVSIVELFDEAGRPVDVDWVHQQGGAISSKGSLLYVAAGMEDEPRGTDGIHVFSLRSDGSGTIRGYRIRRSTKGAQPFNYQFNNDSAREEPEGLTFWDLDDGRGLWKSGQLHAMVVAHPDVWDLSAHDAAMIEHYSSAIYVDLHYARSVMEGSLYRPYDNILSANGLAWDGADIRIKAGSYPEPVTCSKTLRIIAYGGPVTIGR